jgi:apolipoprotein N-acyltransferase
MVLTATNTGITAAIAANGTLLAQLPQFMRGKLELVALGYAGVTPFVRIGNGLALGLCALLLAAAMLVARLQRSR